MNLARSLIFYIGYLIPFTSIWALIVTPVALVIPIKWRFYLIVHAWAYITTLMAQYILGIRYRVQGKEHIPSPQDAALVIVCNHQSAWETFFLQSLIRPQTQVIKRSLLSIPFFGWAYRLLSPIAINRNDKRGSMHQLIEQGTQKLKEGWHVLVFPEGTRTQPGQPKPFSKGAAVLASRANTAIMPITHNAGHYWSNHSFIKRPGVIDVIIHPAVSPIDKEDPRQFMQRIEAIIVRQLAKIS